MSLPTYILEKEALTELGSAMRQLSLTVEPIGLPQKKLGGDEQEWICRDHSGDLFSFSTSEMNQPNEFDLPSGTVLLIPGPPAQRGARAAFQKFEGVLMKLGARRHS